MFETIQNVRSASQHSPSAGFENLLADYSIEVMPRTAAKVADFSSLLAPNTRVYIAHIDGTPIEDMLATARRLYEAGFVPMPHIPARFITSKEMLTDWVQRYANEAGVDQALLLAGGIAQPRGCYRSSIDLLESGLFDAHGFKRLHVAGHPEGNTDIDPDGGTRELDAALQLKQAHSEATDTEMAIVTQFVFEADPVLDWIERLREVGVTLPVHAGISGPAKLQTMIKYGLTCGVGQSLKVLQKRAKDITKLIRPHEPTDLMKEFSQGQSTRGQLVERFHFFPLGGIEACTEWIKSKQSIAAG